MLKVQYTAACDKCGSITSSSTEKMSEEKFAEKAESSPDTHWKELMGDSVVYRHHHESSNNRCKQTC